MGIYIPDETMLCNLANEIEATSPRPHHSALLDIANRIRPGCTFRHALSRGGWYRTGGVITADGRHVADHSDTWAKAELEECAGDFAELLDRLAERGLLVTRHTGRTHYFVAAYGSAPADFLQLEVEELQTVLERKLVDTERLPEDLQDLIDPISPVPLEAQPVGVPRYLFRRLIDMRQAVACVSISEGQDNRLSRILSEWSHSSAATRGNFSDHWIVTLREHQDRYHNAVVSASLLSRHARALKPFHWNLELSGVELGAQLHGFDRATGYPSAWYFHLVAGTITPPKVAYAVERDLDAGFNYLPDTEAVLLKSWVATPYSV